MTCKYCNSDNLVLLHRTVKQGQYVLAESYRCKDCGRAFSTKIKWEDALYLVKGADLTQMCKYATILEDHVCREDRRFCLRNVRPDEVPPACKLQCMTLLAATVDGKLKVIKR